MPTCVCPGAVLGPIAKAAFDPDVYDCARCGHSIGAHDDATGGCSVEVGWTPEVRQAEAARKSTRLDFSLPDDDLLG